MARVPGSATDEQIMFSSNDTPPEEFKMAFADELGAVISLPVILRTLSAPWRRRSVAISRRPSAAVTIRADVFKISNDIMDNPGDAKYGMTT
ncbi:MAG: hypothetical protein ACLR8P_02905 [Clostridium fessum]